MEVGNFSLNFPESYQNIFGGFSPWVQTFIALFLLVLLIFLYALLIWKMHRFIARKNIIQLNLRKYNRSEHPVLSKLFGGFLYFLEYIIILPFFVFFWFAVFTIFITLLSEEISIGTILFISAVIVCAIRFTAYYKESLSRELAKLLPLNFLIIAILSAGFAGFGNIFIKFTEIKDYLHIVPYYLGFIIAIEIILRILDMIFSLFGIIDEYEEQDLTPPNKND